MEQEVKKTEPGEYQVAVNGAGHWELIIAERQSICPFAGAFPMQAQQPQSHLALVGEQAQARQTVLTGFARLPCTTGCPLAELHGEPDGSLQYIVHCGGHPHKMDVTFFGPEPLQDDDDNKTQDDDNNKTDKA